MSTIHKILLIQYDCTIFIKGTYYVQLIINASKIEVIFDCFFYIHFVFLNSF